MSKESHSPRAGTKKLSFAMANANLKVEIAIIRLE